MSQILLHYAITRVQFTKEAKELSLNGGHFCDTWSYILTFHSALRPKIIVHFCIIRRSCWLLLRSVEFLLFFVFCAVPFLCLTLSIIIMHRCDSIKSLAYYTYSRFAHFINLSNIFLRQYEFLIIFNLYLLVCFVSKKSTFLCKTSSCYCYKQNIT